MKQGDTGTTTADRERAYVTHGRAAVVFTAVAVGLLWLTAVLPGLSTCWAGATIVVAYFYVVPSYSPSKTKTTDDESEGE